MKKPLKQIIGLLSCHNPFLLKRMSSGLTVFAFHDVSNHPTEFQKKYGLAISIHDFEEQIDWIKSNFKVISPCLLKNPELNLNNSALITFDDGYAGTFENGLPVLRRKGCESLLFLNMGHIEKKVPLLSALVSYLETYSPEFVRFCGLHNLSFPYHLSITPRLLAAFESMHGLPSYETIEAYSGAMATPGTLDEWDCPGVFYGNHLYEHWNFNALSPDEFKEHYLANQRSLSNYSNHLNLFAFTNGVHPDFKDADIIQTFKALGIQRAFTTRLGINNPLKNEFYLGRVPFGPAENTNPNRWFRLARS